MKEKIIIIVLLTLISSSSAIQWLSLAKAGYPWKEASNCVEAKNDKRLHATQTKLCKRNLELMKVASMASNQILDTCQDVFSTNRWNCTSATAAPNFTPDLTRGTREQAYLYALASAVIVHTVAKSCTDFRHNKCKCGKLPTEPPDGDFQWGGCSDNLNYGLNFGRKFTDKQWKQNVGENDIMALVNRHNNEVGRRIVSSSLRNKCGCIGLFGSCQRKTCWKVLPPFKDIAEQLKLKYNKAIEVEMGQFRLGSKLKPVNKQIASFKRDDLIYVAKSPDYCLEDVQMGSVGTRGRTCNATSSGTDGCASMCCGRGFIPSMQTRVFDCHCKFHWCCNVTCQKCSETVEHQVCH